MLELSSWRLVVDNPGLFGFFAMSSVMMSFPMTATTLFLNRDLGLASKPELITQYYAMELLPCLFKTVYGSASDFLPMFGSRRRPYMFLGACIGATLYMAMGQAVTTYGQMCIIGVLSSIFASIAETGADGALVELAKGDPERAAALQSMAMAIRTLGSFVAGLLSTWAITVASPRTLISISGLFGLPAAVCGLFVKEYSYKNKKDAIKGTDPTSLHPKASRIPCSPLRQLPSEVCAMLPAAVFLMVYNSVPGATAYESYIFTAFPDLTPFELSARTFLGQAGSLLGVLVYWRMFVKTGIRTSLMVTTTLAAFANLTRLVFTCETVTHLPAAYVSILLGVDCLVTNMISRLAFMPLLTMAARYAPRGREATAYAALTTCLDLGDEVGQLTTSALSKALAVGAPPVRSWRHLPLLLLLASLGKVVVLPLLAFVTPPSEQPKGPKTDNTDDDADAMDGSSSSHDGDDDGDLSRPLLPVVRSGSDPTTISSVVGERTVSGVFGYDTDIITVGIGGDESLPAPLVV